jgi:hypothetical protein
MKKLLIIFLMAMLAACNHEENKTKTPQPVHETPNATDTLFVANDDFLADAFDFNTSLKGLRSEFKWLHVTKKEPLENPHLEGVIDTIYTLGTDGTMLTIYKAQSKDIFYKGIIRDPRLKLKRKIHVGMLKNQFLSSFHVPKNQNPIPNAIALTNSLDNAEMVFQFKNDTLREIEYNGYVD